MNQHAFIESELGVCTLQRVANLFGICRFSDVGDPCARTCVKYKHLPQHLNHNLTRIRIEVRHQAIMSHDPSEVACALDRVAPAVNSVLMKYGHNLNAVQEAWEAPTIT